ncbi:MAG: ABC transporter ATP-binding protein/permease [Bacteroidota bacterium]|nr:ABC transporter ATP-binding protein/permease [Bacteroidota bacterium]
MQAQTNLKSLRTLNKYLLRYRRSLFWGILFVVISNFFAVVPAQVVRHALDLVKSNLLLYRSAAGMDLKSSMEVHFGGVLLLFAAIVILMALLKGLFMYFMRQTIIVMSRKIEFDLKNDLYDHFQKLSLSFYRRNNTGDLMARITEDVSRVRMYLGPAIMYLINMFSLILLVIIIMFSVSVKLTLFVLIPLPILAISVYKVNSYVHLRSTRIQAQLSRITTYVQEVFSGIRVIKSFSAESTVHKHFEEENEKYRDNMLSLTRVDALFFPLILMLIGISMLITLYIGGQEVIKGNITTGVIAEFFIYVNLLSWPVASIGWTTSLIQRAAASQERINQFLHEEPEITYSEGKMIRLRGNIEFKNVEFLYPDSGILAIKNVNLHIPTGGSLGIIGRTGSGKSTIAHLALRTYDPTSGHIMIENVDLKEIDLGYYRKQIGYVPQDDFLFSDTIENNILFGFHEEIEDIAHRTKLVQDAARVADIAKDIEGFPQGFMTSLGERGITLSGGQKQRLAIARALVSNPQLLILDDCFSAIDTNTESRILQNLSGIMQDKTTIIISHRVSTVKNTSQIIVLDAGQIVEQGYHDDLIGKKGYYYTLYRKQLVEKELYHRQKEEKDA